MRREFLSLPRERLALPRERLSLRKPKLWYPKWEGVIEGWTIRTVQKHLWRVEFDFDDLYQECAVKFVHLCEVYPLVVDPPHFTALYKTACFNRITDLAKGAMRRSIVELVPDDDFDAVGYDDAELRALVGDAEGPMRKVFEEALRLGRLEPIRFEDGTRETTSEKLARIAGEAFPDGKAAILAFLS